MASILIHDGDVYLIDAGPFIEENLEALGLSINGVKGIFQTHAHDDHFAGITDLIQSGHRLKYYAAPIVRETVNKKISALMGDQAYPIDHFFDVVDLEVGEWVDVTVFKLGCLFSSPLKLRRLSLSRMNPERTNLLTSCRYWFSLLSIRSKRHY